MRFFRILPLVCARMECSLSSFTRNMALGSSSITVPLNSIMSSFDIRPRLMFETARTMGAGGRKVKNTRERAGPVQPDMPMEQPGSTP